MDSPLFTRLTIMNIFKTCSIATSIILLTQCGTSGRVVEKKSNGEFQADHGPFDSKGNYIEGWADNPPRRTYKKSTSKTSKSSSTTKKSTPSKSTSKTTTKPKTSSKSKTKTKPKVIRPKTKPPIMHTVRKGDTVYGLARKYGADPNAIIKANSVKKGIIRIGQRLVIPRK